MNDPGREICYNKPVNIMIKLFATLREYGPAVQEKDVPEGASVGDIVRELNIAADFPMIRLVNGEFAELRTVLKEGDVVALFPPIAGG